MPLEEITFLLASYDKADYLEACFDSLARQTSDRWRALVIDDGSRDASETIYARWASHPKVRILRNPKNMGCVATQRRLVEEAETDIVAVLDPDDALVPTCAERVLAAYDAHPGVGFVYTNFWYCDENLAPKRKGFSKKIPPFLSALDVDRVSHLKSFRRSVYARTDGYDATIHHAEDKDIVLRLEEHTKLLFIDEPLYLYRVLEGSQSHDPTRARLALDNYARARRRARARRLASGYPMTPHQVLLARYERWIDRSRGGR